MIKFITSLSVRWLTWQLRKDKDFWRSYQSNIAMTIYDRYVICSGTDEIHQFSNKCADDFMYLWTRKI